MKPLVRLRILMLALAIGVVFQSCARNEEAPAQQAPAAEQAPQSAAPGAKPTPSGIPSESTENAQAPAGDEAAAVPESPTPAAPGTTRPAQPAPARIAPKDPNVFVVRFQTTKGNIDLECHKDWAPLGAARFRELVESGYYDGARFFRVVPGFVVQFGIAANPLITAKWENSEIQDDPVLQSNTRGTVTFATAGPNTRTTQMFINLADNPRLDGMRFSPVCRVARGMDTVDSIDSRYGEAPQQPLIEDQGEQYLAEQFPQLDKIQSAKVIE